MRGSELVDWKEAIGEELKNNVLPYWERLRIRNGFYGSLDNSNEPIVGSPVGLIMVARLLWTFSRAYRFNGDESSLKSAEFARSYLLKVFRDAESGGYSWEANEGGYVTNHLKLCYGQAFVVYALSEHARATGQNESKLLALELFELLEEHCWDSELGGYIECFDGDWSPSNQMKLGADDLDAPKTMNNHLHMIEAYSDLYALTGNDRVRAACIRLMRTLLDRIIDPSEKRFALFFNMKWQRMDDIVSPGHDIEGSWLLWEAAEIIGDVSLIEETKQVSLAMAERVLLDGFDDSGAIVDEYHLGKEIPTVRTWWPQAEGMVGFYNAYQISKDERFLQASKRIWEFIEKYIVDKENGEWYWGLDVKRQPLALSKAGPWKAPYHNGRACIEMLERIDVD